MGEHPNGTIYIHAETDDYPYILFESSSMGHLVIAPNIKPYNNSELNDLKNNEFTSKDILNNIIDTLKYSYIITFENIFR